MDDPLYRQVAKKIVDGRSVEDRRKFSRVNF